LKVEDAQYKKTIDVSEKDGFALTLFCQKCFNSLGVNRADVTGKDDQKQEDDSQVVKEVEGDKGGEKEKEEAPRTELD